MPKYSLEESFSSLPSSPLESSPMDLKKLIQNREGKTFTLDTKTVPKISQKLDSYMQKKQTQICVAADFLYGKELLDCVKKIAPHICVLKTHIDLLKDFNQNLTQELKHIAKEEGFLIFEDRKFADIGKTVQRQYAEGIYEISSWADIINMHPLVGAPCIQALQDVAMQEGEEKGLLLLAQMSCSGNLISPEYTQHSIEMAKKHADFVMGFVSQRRLCKEKNFFHMMPGVKILEDPKQAKDLLGQNYISPEEALLERKVDILIIGRGITQEKDMKKAASLYQKYAWNLSFSKT